MTLKKMPKRDWKAHAEQYYHDVEKWRKESIVELEKHLILLNERLKEEPYPWISTDALILQAGISQLKEFLEALR